ncbi:YeeE/YedE thiosulfate transporter family protein [Pelagicoccus albus]|uniref:YeeE/YedE family protein n=1 Tax=Pelagicoccus albus TaxID=415222 RepID=A0A7X1E9X8_9BACT|nr:YeeE/YedE thiosulfate transporter family protein [Pelagicoccus albus]MBC2607821.1 YeeE/YedE family protein [Pelagicoccus albus]
MKNRIVSLTLLLLVPAGALSGRGSELAMEYGEPSWSPILVGFLIGILVCLSMLVAKKPIGASSSYATLAGMVGKSIAPKTTSGLPYYRENPPKFNYGVVFILAVVIGSLVAASSGGTLEWQAIPPYWQDIFGEDSAGQRFLWAFLGGIFLAVGARTAGGCTSGHGISGALQLSAASWVSLISFFAGGVMTAKLIYPSF